MSAECRVQSAELWDLRSAILSDLVGADIKSDTTDIIHSQRKALKVQNAKRRINGRIIRPIFLSAGGSVLDSVLFKAFSEREGGTAQAVTDGCLRQRQAVAGQNGSRVQNEPSSGDGVLDVP